MASPSHIATGSAKGKKKAAGISLRKSIAWNPAFFTEEGVLDNSELSKLTSSQLMANGSPSSGVNGIVSPLCRSKKFDNTYVLKQAAEKSPGKLTSNYSHAEGRRLFSSAKTPQREEQKGPAVTKNTSSARSFQKCIPRVPSGTRQNKIPNSTSTAHMSRIPKRPLSSLPMALRSTTPVTTVSKSNKKLAPVKIEHVHRVSELLPKTKIGSGHMEMDVVPGVAAIHEESSDSVKFTNPQISPSSFGGTTSTIGKPSALRMPSPSVGFFTQKNAQTSHGNAAERNAGRISAGSTLSLVKPPRYKLPEDLKAGLHLSKVLSTNCTTASNLVPEPVLTDSNTNTLVTSEKRSLSKIISTYSSKSRDVNDQERQQVYCSLAGSGATTQPLSSEKNNVARNSVPIVYKDTSDVEIRGTIKEIEPVENSLSLKATSFSTIEATCSSTKPTEGSKVSPSCISSQRNNLSCQSKTESCSVAVIELGNSHVGERKLLVSLSEGETCTLDIDSFRNSDSCDHHSSERATSMEPMRYTLCADQFPPSGSSSDGNPDLADRKYILNDSLYDEGESAMSEEPHTDGGAEFERNKTLVVKDPLLQVGCEHGHSLPVKAEAPMACVEKQKSVEVTMEDKMVFRSNRLLAQEGSSPIEKTKAVDRSRTNTILRDHLKSLVPFTEEWFAVMETCGQDALEQKSGAVQHSPPERAAPEPSPWSPVKRKAQDVGPFDCTKYSKSVRKSGTP